MDELICWYSFCSSWMQLLSWNVFWNLYRPHGFWPNKWPVALFKAIEVAAVGSITWPTKHNTMQWVHELSLLIAQKNDENACSYIALGPFGSRMIDNSKSISQLPAVSAASGLQAQPVSERQRSHSDEHVVWSEWGSVAWSLVTTCLEPCQGHGWQRRARLCQPLRGPGGTQQLAAGVHLQGCLRQSFVGE